MTSIDGNRHGTGGASDAHSTSPLDPEDPTPKVMGVSVSTWRRKLSKPALWVFFVDVALLTVFGWLSPGHRFISSQNFINMGLDGAEIVLLAAGVALLMGAGEIDISLGADVVLSSAVGAEICVHLAGSRSQVSQQIYPHLWLGVSAGIAAAVLTGMAFGLVNGLLVTRLRINSFITTLATLGIGTGLALVVTGGQDVASVPPQLQKHFGVYRIGGAIPATVTVTAVVAVTLWFVATRTRFGLRSVALGSSRQAATRAGIRARRHLLRLFVLAGGCAGVASVMDFSRFNTTNIGGHQLDALQAIAGVVIGGGAIAGGAVSIGGAVLGALMAVLLESGLVILGLQPFYNQIVIGIVLLVAVYLRSRRDGAAGTEDERGGTEHARRFRRPSRPTD